MTTDLQPIDWETIEYHLNQLPSTFEHRRAELNALTNQLHELAETHCTGAEHWRDANTNNRKPKLYIIHRTDATCPVHGEPEPGKRIRTYIGSNPDNIRDAQAAIERGRQYLSIRLQLKRKHQATQHANHALRRIFWALELELPQPPFETPPEQTPTG